MSQLQYTPITTATISASPTGLSRNGSGVVSVVLSATPTGTPLAVGVIITLLNNTAVGATDFNGSYPIATLTDQTHLTYQQSASLGADTGGGGQLLVSPAQFTDILDADLVQDKPVTTSLLTNLSHNNFFGAVRCEVFNAGYWIHGSTVPTPSSPVDQYKYSTGECIFIPIFASSRQPLAVGAGYTLGQQTFPVLANSDVGSGSLALSPYHLYISSAGVVTSNVYFASPGSGSANQGTVQVIVVGQRLAGLTFADGPPAFVNLNDSELRGGAYLSQSKIRALSRNAKFGMMRLEVKNAGYYRNGDTVALPTSPVDGYSYSRNECLYLPILGSTRQPAGGFTPGQLTFPSLSGSDIGTGDLLESPYKLYITGSTGVVTSTMYFSTSGIAAQGTVQVVVFMQRSSIQSQR